MYASHETSLESVQRQPSLTRYAQNWGRAGDVGFVAYIDELNSTRLKHGGSQVPALFW
jgi:hypothetical protein